MEVEPARLSQVAPPLDLLDSDRTPLSLGSLDEASELHGAIGDWEISKWLTHVCFPKAEQLPGPIVGQDELPQGIHYDLSDRARLQGRGVDPIPQPEVL